MRRLEWPLHIVRRVVVAVVVVAVLAVAVPLAVDRLGDIRARCADGVVKMGEDDECVGVTDGSFRFAGHLAAVERKIKEENDLVLDDAKKESYVSVAYMTSFTLTNDDSNSADSVRHELEGAYLAQYRHNRGDLASSPKIRLLIANTGSSSAHWEHTVDELIDRRDSEDRLVAVTGLGPSTARNLSALRKLSGQGLATVASTMTATNISDIPGFVRVSPTNVDEAYAGAAFLKRKKFRTAVVVQDSARNNLYAATLGTAFTRAFPDGEGGQKLLAERLTYDSSLAGSWKNELRFFPAQLCDLRPQVIYFAGRGRHLTNFLDALANRVCTDHTFTVLAGDDTSNLEPQQIANAVENDVQVFFTGLAHRDMWRAEPDRVSGRSAAYFQKNGRLDTWFPHDDRYDGQDIMAHDAVLTAAEGIRMAAEGDSSKVTGEAVGRMFHQMNGPFQLAGASGFISFQNNGNPRNKAVPILSLNARGRTELVEVSAARGKPPEGQ
ncbi:ABC transporter substrate-binding protein [Streptomyces sp. NPDC002018]|uniref:ABC transporter substrate-binding protein n=1 Tax=Streptomyces sp. NPDC002018 TaxID=3364629 RepID=UPI0036A59882